MDTTVERAPGRERRHPFYEALRSLVVAAARSGRVLLRARMLYRDELGRVCEEVVVARRVREEDLRPIEAVWRVERLDAQGRRRGSLVWLDEAGSPT